MDPAPGEADFAAFAASSRDALLRFALALDARSLADAEDLVQAALIRVAARWHDVEVPLAYTRRAIARLAIDRARSAERRREQVGLVGLDADPLHPGSRSAAQDPAERVADSDHVWRLLGTLPARQRQALVLRYIADVSEAETARILGCPLGTVKSEVHRALRRLRAQLAGEPD
jgi:RNA polymerase sigma-70 factor (sigma-E family)